MTPLLRAFNSRCASLEFELEGAEKLCALSCDKNRGVSVPLALEGLAMSFFCVDMHRQPENFAPLPLPLALHHPLTPAPRLRRKMHGKTLEAVFGDRTCREGGVSRKEETPSPCWSTEQVRKKGARKPEVQRKKAFLVAGAPGRIWRLSNLKDAGKG
jgi:hypothetical protein